MAERKYVLVVDDDPDLVETVALNLEAKGYRVGKAFDGVEAGISRGVDCIFVDTAGRLHTKVNLMEELKKVKRTIQKRLPGAPHEILLVLDATTGQNALSQARLFHEAIGVTGIALTKLDGTAKGGIVISICSQMNVPLRYIGVGEQVEDLQEFDPETFANALFS